MGETLAQVQCGRVAVVVRKNKGHGVMVYVVDDMIRRVDAASVCVCTSRAGLRAVIDALKDAERHFNE